MSKLPKISFLLGASLGLVGSAVACGPWLPNRLLDNGGKIILDAPEFYFEFELKEIAKDYTGPFKAVQPASASSDENASTESQTALIDRADFAEAMTSGYLKLADPQKAIMAHDAMRVYLDNLPLGQPVPEMRPENDEFAIYQRGALAFLQNKPVEARAAWESLMALPKEQRIYRSTWATFMLGKMQMTSDPAVAKKWFQRTRQLALEGLRDSLGLAAASYGWEAQMALNAKALEEAAPLYLRQLATGDLTAVESAKQLAGDAYPEQLPRFAADPLLRRITSAHLLGMSSSMYGEEDKKLPESWLAAVEKSGTLQISEAPRLGWLAYAAGEYDQATRWLKKSDPQNGLALWLQAKLDFRAGKIAEAEAAMSAAIRQLPAKETIETYEANFEQIMPPVAAAGDLGLLQVGRGEFIEALKTFLQNSPTDDGGDHWQDASWLAERVLTTEELTDFLKNLPWSTAQDDAVEIGPDSQRKIPAGFENTFALRWLLARRLVREEKYDQARAYFPKSFRPVLDQYVAALQKSHSDQTSKADRAAALWEAAQLVRKQGMELMGTENEPDAFVWDGSFETSNVSGERLAGKYLDQDYVNNTNATRPLVIPATKEEHRRLAAHPVKPEKRFHYRYLAANLAWEAAKLMPDQSEDTARVLNTAGTWLRDRDDQAADRFLQAIERRCPDTPTGQAALKIHWFPPLPDITP